MKPVNEEFFGLIENFIRDYKSEFDRSPSVREIGSALNIPKSTAGRYLAMLKERGVIDYDGPRSIKTIEETRAGGALSLVMIGETVSCGAPKESEGTFREYVRLPGAIFGKGEMFMLTADGDSMINAGINSGDMLILKRESTARNGQIVLAYDPESQGITLKRFFRDEKNREIILHPENPDLEDIRLKNVQIQGVLVSVIKRSDSLETTYPQGWR
ncbi:MAG: transcriptional repressor LexA [Clostridiales bacterium]|nr:transcriptional repressor LexA [Clostridiales bacterium]